ncbi:MAG: methyltransferase domain-containing protein [Armatimonadota bacterium]
MEATESRTANVPELGDVTVLREFEGLVRGAPSIVVMDATGSPAGIFDAVADGAVVVLTGPWRYLDAIMRYLQRRERELVDRSEFASIENRFARSQAHRAALRAAVARVMVIVHGDALWRVTEHPNIAGLTDWLEPQEPPERPATGLTESPLLLPLRRLQRTLTDMRRAAEGLHIGALDARLTVLPFVYVPQDDSVVDLLAEGLGDVEGACVLDMGTGTGVLAFVAARAGARVVATDNSPHAVENARRNVERLGIGDRVEVRGPADLFDSVECERFDLVIFNAPWVYGEPETLYDAAIYDEDFRVITGFMERVGDHLTEGGRVLLLYSNISELTGHGSLTRVRELAAERGLDIVSERYATRVGRVLGARERVYLLDMRRAEGASGGTAE